MCSAITGISGAHSAGLGSSTHHLLLQLSYVVAWPEPSHRPANSVVTANSPVMPLLRNRWCPLASGDWQHSLMCWWLAGAWALSRPSWSGLGSWLPIDELSLEICLSIMILLMPERDYNQFLENRFQAKLKAPKRFFCTNRTTVVNLVIIRSRKQLAFLLILMFQLSPMLFWLFKNHSKTVLKSPN